MLFIADKAIAEAASRGVAPDFMYCMRLLEETGVVVVPGSGFGQVEGTHHFRTTILPPEELMDEVMEKMTTATPFSTIVGLLIRHHDNVYEENTVMPN